MTADEALLRRLLPSFFWLRDDEHGKALTALVSALAEQHAALRADVERLYDDLFIETCRSEVIPLIGENVGVSAADSDDRAWVGQIVGLRRRKGTLATLVRGVAVATGWGVLAQDAVASLGRTQTLLDPDPGQGMLLDLSDAATVERLGEPSSRVTRLGAISGRTVVAGTHAPIGTPGSAAAPAPASATVGIWRLRSFWTTGRTPRAAADAPPSLSGRAFRIDPFGRDVPLFSVPTDGQVGGGEPEVAHALGIAELRRLLRGDESRRRATPLRVRVAHGEEPLRALSSSSLRVADLRHWRVPPQAEGWASAVVDPLHGRLVILAERPTTIEVDSAYGFSGELGGGPYGAAAGDGGAGQTMVIRVARSGRGAHRTLAAALAAWRAASPMRAVISMESSRTDSHSSGEWRVELAAGRRLAIVSAEHAAPLLDGDLHAHVHEGSELRVCGLTVGGTVNAHGDGALELAHTTVAPHGSAPRMILRGRLAVSATRCVLGTIQVAGAVQLVLRASIVGGAIGDARRALETLDAAQSTILGITVARVLLAEDCIFAAPVTSTARDWGTICTSFLPLRSTPPRLVSCLNETDGRPRFTSTRWGAPGYGQLDAEGPAAIATGAADGGELGAFNWLEQPRRFQRLSAVLHELLPAGIGAVIELHT
jgi:hypothetical protein